MKVLVVARRKNGNYAPFITEQMKAVEQQGVECEYFGVDGKGIWGYLRQIPKLKAALLDFNPDIIHAHYGLCGLLANYQRKIPVITTYHGSDINDPRVLRLSKICIHRSRFNIFVSQKNLSIAHPRNDYSLIPCGIDLEDYPFIEKSESRRLMKLSPCKKYVLFAGAFDNPVKNASLAKAAVDLVSEAELLELKGYTRKQVSLLMQAVDAFLMTSHTEGSPQVIKEALACGCPIVSVDVGDVAERVSGIDGCYIASSDAKSLADAICQALAFKGRTCGREAIMRDSLNNTQIAAKLKDIYRSICS